MAPLIQISKPQDQLRQNRFLLLLMGGVSSVAGLFLWSAPPFIWSNSKNQVDIFWRYLSLAGSLGCGVAAIASGYHLNRISPLLKALDVAERDDFLTSLATSQFVQQQHWQQQALQPAPLQQPFQAGSVSGNAPVTDVTAPVAAQRSSDGRFSEVTDASNGSGNNPGNAVTKSYRPLYYAVVTLQQQGVSDSKIIKEVLKQQGRNFETGKQMLETLLQLGQSQGW